MFRRLLCLLQGHVPKVYVNVSTYRGNPLVGVSLHCTNCLVQPRPCSWEVALHPTVVTGDVTPVIIRSRTKVRTSE